ncbi:MAG: c-type cytochrome [Chitinophagales bacterium]
MKYLLYLSALLFCFFFIQCTAKKKVEYDIPSHYSKQARANAIDWFEKGEILYKINCSGCHGIYQKGKKTVPNFTKTQIDNYNAMFIKGDPKNHSVAAKLSQEQLYYVLTFLRLRKIEK